MLPEEIGGSSKIFVAHAMTMMCASWAPSYGLVVAGPVLAWLYAVVTLIFLWAWHECAFSSMTSAISLRTALLATAVAVSAGLCQQGAGLEASIPFSIILSVASIWFIHQTRVNEIEGGPAPKLGGGCMKGKVVFVTGANAGIVRIHGPF